MSTDTDNLKSNFLPLYIFSTFQYIHFFFIYGYKMYILLQLMPISRLELIMLSIIRATQKHFSVLARCKLSWQQVSIAESTDSPQRSE